MACKIIVNIRVFVIAIFIVLFSSLKAYAVDTILKVAFDPYLPPYQFMENNKYIGMHIDMLDKIADEYNFKIEYIPIENTSKCIEALENGQVDIVLGVMLNDNAKYKVKLTENISQSSICMIAHNSNIENIQNKTGDLITALENDTISYSFTHNMGNLKTVVVSNQVRAFDLLVSKRADILIGVKNSIVYQLEKVDLENEYTIVNNYMVPIEYAMAVKSGDEDLQKKLNKGLQQLRISGEYEKIHEKWVNEYEYAIREIIKKAIYIAAIAMSIIAATFIFNLRLSILLKKQVNEKTKELRKINKDLESQIIETRNNNELKNCIVENSPSGIIVFDRECKITLFNQSASKLTGIYEPPIGQSIFEIELLKNILYYKKDTVFLQGSKSLNEEITLKNSFEENIRYRYDIYQLFDFNNSVRGAILTIDDITKEIEVKEQIFEKEKNKALNRIIAGIAHEIRNPIMSIKTFVELIPLKRDSVQFQDQLAEFVPKEVDRVNNLITNLIDYAKPKNNNKEIVVIKEVIKSCAILLKPMIENKKIAFNINIEDELTIMVDKNQLKQVLINIIINGFESITEKIKMNGNAQEKLNMYLNAWKDEQYVFVQVIDEGIGMDTEEIQKSTEPFFSTKTSGTGLGLSISKQYVEENRGTMIIESIKFKHTKITLKFER